MGAIVARHDEHELADGRRLDDVRGAPSPVCTGGTMTGMQGRLLLDAFGISESGPVRRRNEDAFLVDPDLSLFVVADGMGGHAAGEVASRLAVEAIHDFVRRSAGAGDLSWPCGIDPGLSRAGNRLRTAIFLANRRVFHAAAERHDYAGMGTTVVCGLVSGARLVIGHAGDSRLYVLTRGALSSLTRDDTWAATIQDAGGDAHAAAEHPMRHVLTNVLGTREHAEIHLDERPLAAGDVLLLCSDGVHGVLDHDALARLLSGATAGARAVTAGVIAAALAGGTRDNVTAIVVRCLDAGERSG